MTISIDPKQDSSYFTKIHFQTTLPSGRKSDALVTITHENAEYNEPTLINIPACGDIRAQDVDEFIQVLKIAKMIATGEIEIY